MGSDEHGPAYPEPPRKRKTYYRCPVCGGDANRYQTCEYPGCYDGRDPGHPYARYLAAQRKSVTDKTEPGDPYLDHAIGERRSPPLWERIAVSAFVSFVVTTLFWLFHK